MRRKLNTIPEAIDAMKKGRMVIVVDDEERENEGDFITAARHATPQVVNFMSKQGRGLICIALTEQRCDELDLNPMVANNTALHRTAFTVSVDLLGHGCTTGISAFDRAKTIKALIDPESISGNFAKPGHIFPLRAKQEGVLRRTGHTEAAIDLARLAGFEPAGVLVEIMHDDGTMARLPELLRIAKKLNLKIISIKELVAYRMQNERLIEKVVTVNLPTRFGNFKLTAFRQTTTGEIHIALVKGTWKADEPVMVRVHSSCLTGDVLGSLRCDCGDQLHKAMDFISREEKGVLLYMKQEGRGIGLLNKLKAYKLQEEGVDTVDANLALGFKMDERDYGIGAQILRSLGISKIRLLTNNPRKRVGLSGYGLTIVENISLQAVPNRYNLHYLRTKKNKMGHEIEV